MQNTFIRHPIRWAIAALCLAALTTSAPAGSFTRGCAARDLQVLQLIEGREGADAISEQQLAETLNKMMNARIICHEGYVLDALAIYDSIAKNITVDPVTLGQRQ